MGSKRSNLAESEEISRRKRPRYAADIRVELFTRGLQHWIAERTANISVGGLFVCTESDSTIGERVHMRIYLQDRDAFFDMKGKVVWCCNGEDSHPKGLGIEFIEVTEIQQRVIDQVLKDYVNVRDA